MVIATFAMAAARLRANARLCRLAAFKMQPSIAQSALVRIAARWDLMAAAEARAAALQEPANDR